MFRAQHEGRFQAPDHVVYECAGHHLVRTSLRGQARHDGSGFASGTVQYIVA